MSVGVPDPARAARRGLGAVTGALLLASAACLGAESADAPPGAGAEEEEAAELEPTWTGGVGPILRENCVTCHRPGGAGPFPLLDYDDARVRGELIASVTGRRYMPPWQPSRPVGVFANERGLTDREIDLIREWVDAGMPRGEGELPPPPPEIAREWQLGEPDLVAEMDTTYLLGADGEEEFRNFVIPAPLDEGRWIAAVEYLPGNPRVVHHATLAVDPTHRSRRLAAEDPALGYDGMGAAGGADHPTGFFVGWTPGKVPDPGPAGVSWRLEAGTDIVSRLHLRPVDEPVRVRSRVGLHFADGPPERTPVVVRMGSESLHIPAGEPAYEVRDSFELPVDAEALSVYPHAHYLGDRVQAWARTPAGDTVWLVEIPDWDFNWQDSYRYDEPIPLPAGTTLHLRWLFDNTADNPLNPNDPPLDVTYGPRSVDEMADLMVQVLPGTPRESALLQAEVEAHSAAIRARGMEDVLAREPDDPTAHYNLGIALAGQGRRDEAVEHFRRALRLDPDLAGAHNNLGIVLHQQGHVKEAAGHYRQALELEPDDARLHHNLGMALLALDRPAEAEGHFRRAVELDAGFAMAHEQLGELARTRGEGEAAEEHFRKALEGSPGDPEVHYGLAYVLAATDRVPEALEHFREATRANPAWPQPRLALAEILANHPDPRIRNPRQAVEQAEAAVRLTGDGNPVALMSLAGAYASAGDRRRAVSAAERALAVAREAGAAPLVRAIERRLAAWRGTAGRP